MKRVFTPAKKKTILIVDDDHLAVRIYHDKFVTEGFKVEVAADIDGAMHTFKKDVVDLVVVDLCLPGINAVELIKNIRSDSDLQSLPLVAFSNPYLSSLARSATEAGATRCVTKIDSTPEQMLELARELGVTATSKVVVGNPAGTVKTNPEKFAETFLLNGSETLAKLRAGYLVFARIEQEDVHRAELLEMRRQLRSLTGGAGLLGFEKIGRMSTGLEALLIELHTKPAKITPSVVRTVAQAIDTLASLFDRAAKSQPETLTSAKILVVDDEVISRETICSALGKAGLDPVSLDDSLAAQHLLEKDHFDLIFLDVEMPGQTGLQLCVKIREMMPNSTTPVVFVTSHSDFGSRAQSTLSGGNDFIAKPFVLVELAVKALTWLFKDSAHSHSTPQRGASTEPASSVPEQSVPEADMQCHEPRAT